VALLGCSITCTAIERLAIHFETSSDIKEPAKPISAEKISKDVRFRSTPLCANKPCIPNKLKVTLNKAKMAMLVPKKRIILSIKVSKLIRYNKTV
jgi:hypothetical protein